MSSRETPAEDEIVVVSAIALDGLDKAGYDCSRVLAPGPAIRDDAGQQIGCHGLSAAPLTTARAELPAIDGIADNVYWGLMGAWIAGGNGGIEPTRAEAARLLRGLTQPWRCPMRSLIWIVFFLLLVLASDR